MEFHAFCYRREKYSERKFRLVCKKRNDPPGKGPVDLMQIWFFVLAVWALAPVLG